MITTKFELILAAQAAAAKSLNITEDKALHEFLKAEFDALAIPDTNRQWFNDHFNGARRQYHINDDVPLNPPARKSVVATVLLAFAMITALVLDWMHGAAATATIAMAWPTTGTSGPGHNAGQYVSTGNASTILWGTANIWAGSPPTGFLVITKFSQKTKTELVELPNGDGLTAGTVQLIDGFTAEIEVRDDVNQVTTNLTSGARLYILDEGGLVPGGVRGAQYRGILADTSWDAAPKTPAGRMLSVHVYLLIS